MGGEAEALVLAPRGVVDLRGEAGAGLVVAYPADAVVVVSGLPGAGKSTLGGGRGRVGGGPAHGARGL